MSESHGLDKRLTSYFAGLTNGPGRQPPDVRGDTQLQVIKGYLVRDLECTDVPITVMDFGCGDGPLPWATARMSTGGFGPSAARSAEVTTTAQAPSVSRQKSKSRSGPQ